MSTLLLDAAEIKRMQDRLLAQLLENIENPEDLVLVGIERRGAILARRLAHALSDQLSFTIAYGSLDINLYRDDWTRLVTSSPKIGQSNIPHNLDGKNILLVDDVLFSGRTIRAALEAILDYGRPAKVQLLVFIDRGHRELPICANYIGRHIETEPDAHIDVLFEELDKRDAVILSETKK